ncbi:hypothetical protein SeMB42_g07093 [Synchytrium endobioticum]|uniref:BTB domain-containing protein n=1 Tax=Synchytrium endobioticum TaxID=286115 RepID=A0A507D497_9FUNG|nr:hypothetical protein SeMB42_g07093 [Synchytrium endobioticum]TPX46115.1 hypothetical protein SeLEV6574_g03418 [Synchytrium endobioticum]
MEAFYIRIPPRFTGKLTSRAFVLKSYTFTLSLTPRRSTNWFVASLTCMAKESATLFVNLSLKDLLVGASTEDSNIVTVHRCHTFDPTSGEDTNTLEIGKFAQAQDVGSARYFGVAVWKDGIEKDVKPLAYLVENEDGACSLLSLGSTTTRAMISVSSTEDSLSIASFMNHPINADLMLTTQPTPIYLHRIALMAANARIIKELPSAPSPTKITIPTHLTHSGVLNVLKSLYNNASISAILENLGWSDVMDAWYASEWLQIKEAMIEEMEALFVTKLTPINVCDALARCIMMGKSAESLITLMIEFMAKNWGDVRMSDGFGKLLQDPKTYGDVITRTLGALRSA